MNQWCVHVKTKHWVTQGIPAETAVPGRPKSAILLDLVGSSGKSPPDWAYLHPGRLTAGTYSHHPFGKEHDRNQTSMIMFHANLQGCKGTPTPRIAEKKLRYLHLRYLKLLLIKHCITNMTTDYSACDIYGANHCGVSNSGFLSQKCCHPVSFKNGKVETPCTSNLMERLIAPHCYNHGNLGYPPNATHPKK